VVRLGGHRQTRHKDDIGLGVTLLHRRSDEGRRIESPTNPNTINPMPSRGDAALSRPSTERTRGGHMTAPPGGPDVHRLHRRRGAQAALGSHRRLYTQARVQPWSTGGAAGLAGTGATVGLAGTGATVGEGRDVAPRQILAAVHIVARVPPRPRGSTVRDGD